MFEIYGKYTSALIYSDICEQDAVSQIYNLCNHPVFEGAQIRIMPDVHAGAGCTVGTTVRMKRRAVIPSIVGADIGCGVLTTFFDYSTEIDFRALDSFIFNSIPSGMTIRRTTHPLMNNELKRQIHTLTDDLKMYKSTEAFIRSCGSLGGGNHYIEIGEVGEGRYALSIHTGSRGLGKCVAEYFGDLADKYVTDRHITGINRNMPYIEDDEYDLYLEEMTVAMRMAAESRRLIASDILSFLGAKATDSFDTVHNYIEMCAGGEIIIRKGAVSAKAGERLAIPLNMRDGVLVVTGKGNPEWNFSAPHGAGRLMSRAEAKATLSLSDYENEMKGIQSWSVLTSTLDESPMAYKPMDAIMNEIGESVKVEKRIKPLYNFKARSISGKT